MPAATPINSIKQAAEFGITQGGQSLAGLLIFITDVHALGLETAQGLVLTESFYWDLNDDTRAWSERFAEAHGGAKPTMVHAGVYSSASCTTSRRSRRPAARRPTRVMAKMKETPTSDPLFGEGEVRADGRKLHDMYLFRVKAPDASEGPWDYYELVATIPAAEAFRPLEEGGCPLVQLGPRAPGDGPPVPGPDRKEPRPCSSSSASRPRPCSASCCSG